MIVVVFSYTKYAHETGKMTRWKMVNYGKLAKNGLLYSYC